MWSYKNKETLIQYLEVKQGSIYLLASFLESRNQQYPKYVQDRSILFQNPDYKYKGDL